MMLTVLIPCEMYQNYLDRFNDFTNVTFYCPEDMSINTMLKEISDTADMHNILIFKINNVKKSLFYSEITSYADTNAKKYLNNEYNIKSGYFKSLFSGETKVVFKNFSSIDSKLLTEDPHFQLVGKDDDMRAFKSELVNKYGGSFPKNDGYDSRKDNRVTTISLWIIYIAISAFFTLYETLKLKKEHFIRITLGENLFYLWLKHIVSDLIFMCILYLISLFTGIMIYDTISMFKYSQIMFVILLVVDILISTNLLIYNKNKVLANSYVSGFLLVFSKSVKCIIIILNVICMSTSLSLIYECYSYYKQKSFYEQYSNYCVIQNIKKTDSFDTFYLEGKFYKEYNESLNIIYICDRFSIRSSDELVVEANKNAISYLKDQIKELKNADLEKDVYIIHHADTRLTDEDISFLSPHINASVTELIYNNSIELVAVNLDSDTRFTTLKHNPVIVYYNKDFSQLFDDSMISMEVPIVYCLIKNSDVIGQFMEENNMSCSITNVMDIFNQKWLELKRTLYISIILTVLVLIMQIVVIGSIIRLEYATNAVKLSIQKVLGYSIFHRFINQYLITFIVYFVALSIAVIISNKAKIGVAEYMIYGSVFTYLLDTIIFTIYAQKIDKDNIQRILKGGSI